MLPVVPPEAGPDATCTDPELPDVDVPVAIDIAPLSPLPAGDAVPEHEGGDVARGDARRLQGLVRGLGVSY